MNHTFHNANIQKIFFLTFFDSLVFAYVVERVFAEARGLTILQMQYIGIIFSMISFALEVPSGALADKWKKKYVLALGLGFCLFEFFISIFAHNFEMFVLAFVAAAIGCSLKSGTIDALLYQSLQDLGRTDEFEKLKGYLKLINYVTIGVAGLLGGYIAHRYGMEMNYWLSLCGTPLALVMALTLDERTMEERSETQHLFVHIGSALKQILGNRSLRSIFFYSGLTGAVLFGQLWEMPSLTYAELDIPLYLYGLIGLMLLAVGGWAATLADRLKQVFSYGAIFKSTLVLAGIMLYCYSVSTHWLGLLYLLSAIFLLEMVTPLISGYIHHQVEDQYRTTIGSAESLIINGFSAVVGLIFGYFADHYSIFGGFKSMAILLGVYAVFYLPTVVREDVKGNMGG